MVVSNQGLTRCVTVITDDIDDGRAGTGTTAATAADTDLETAVAATEADVTIVTNAQGFTTEHLIVSTAGNGNDLTEWQTRMNSEATQLCRSNTAAISKTASIEVAKLTVFTVVGG